MLKIIIDGEGSRIKKEVTTFKNANYEIGMRCNATEGYNKTWVTISKDDNIIVDRVRLDLTTSDRLTGLKGLLIENANNSISYYKREPEKFSQYIKEAEKFISIIQAMDDNGEFKNQFNYTFWLKGEKIWEYTINELQDNSYTETTLKILSGEVKGYGEAIPNCKKEDILVRIKELSYSL